MLVLNNDKIRKIFIGKSPLTEQTKFSGGYGPKFDGNTILVNVNPDKGGSGYEYICINSNIFKFTTEYPIIKYVSPVGNSDVPYHYAIDSKGQYYLLLENVIVQNVPSKFMNEPYDYYYDEPGNSSGFKPIKNIEIIEARDF